MAIRFLTNHIGYEPGIGASALLELTEEDRHRPLDSVELLTSAGWTVAAKLPLGPVARGFDGSLVAPIDLSRVAPGRYALSVSGVRSHAFWIEEDFLSRTTLSALLDYFRSQRSHGPWERADAGLGFVGERHEKVDVRGGYFDASGDVSKYLSHLSYANFFNPQQTPLVVWAMAETLERRRKSAPGVRERLVDELGYGAEFLLRMQDPSGYFYMTVFDQWSKSTERRVLCAYRGQTGELLDGYQAGYRQGGGLAIAALARAGRLLRRNDFVEAAARGFAHLEAHNQEYLDDGKENILDDYSALLAAAELFSATRAEGHRAAAETRLASLESRIREDGPHPGWLRADDGERPFFHASDAGLPVVALLRAGEIVPNLRQRSIAASERVFGFELWAMGQVDNPFGLARQFVQDASGARRTSFFIPHDNETGYWWQGENARLASLAAAAVRLANVTENSSLRHELRGFAHDQLHWICGRNPFDACMLHGFGFGNRHYMDEWPSVLGGILNGITAGYDQRAEISFGRDDVTPDQNWRWFEQWLPHSSWFLIALAALDERAI